MGGKARTGVRVRRVIVASLGVLTACSVPLGASAAPSLPNVAVPAPRVQVPELPPVVPAPAPPRVLPAPLPAPAPPRVPPAPLPAPAPPVAMPQPPAAPPAPAAPRAPTVQAPAETLGRAVGNSVQSVADGSRDAVPAPAGATAPRGGRRDSSAGGNRGGDGTASGKRGGDGTRRSRAVARYHRRQRLVRRLRGCLDALAPLHTRLLVLRFGVGETRPRSATWVARTLGLSRRRYEAAGRRAIRRLVTVGRTTGCRRTGTGQSLAAYDSAPAGAGGVLAFATLLGSTSESRSERTGESRVLGESESSDGGEADGRQFPRRATGLVPGSSDIPFLLGLAVLIAAVAGGIAITQLRRAARYPYERD